MIFVKSEKEIDKIRDACKIVKETLEFVGSKIQVGMSTKEVDELVERYIRASGANPSCLGYGGFPASACVSVNEMVVHGIPDHDTVLNFKISFLYDRENFFFEGFKLFLRHGIQFFQGSSARG